MGADEAAGARAIGARIRARRKALGMSQAELARRALVGEGWLSLLETGRKGPAQGVERLARMAAVVGVSLEHLAHGSEPAAPDPLDADQYAELRGRLCAAFGEELDGLFSRYGLLPPGWIPAAVTRPPRCHFCPRPATGVRISRVRLGPHVQEVEVPVCGVCRRPWRFARRLRRDRLLPPRS